MINPQYIVYLLAALILSVIIFLLLREFFCWYFKINKRISLMEEMLVEIKKSSKDSVIYGKTNTELSIDNSITNNPNPTSNAHCPKCNSIINAEIVDGKIKNGYIACHNCKYIVSNEEYFGNIKA